jgi:NADH:ubiquinone reductase (H+-translocating)
MQSHDPVESGGSRILILGGGFAGVYAAYELQRTTRGMNAEIMVVNRDNSFVFYPLMPEIVSGAIETESILSPIRQFVPQVDLYVGEVTEIDLGRRCVEINHGLYGHQQYPRTLFYDHLVLALGGVPNTSPVEGLAEHGYDVAIHYRASREEAQEVAERLLYVEMRPVERGEEEAWQLTATANGQSASRDAVVDRGDVAELGDIQLG